MMAEMLVLRLVHVVGGVFWVGAMMYNAFFLMPIMAQAGPAAAGPIIAGFQQRKLFVWLPVVAILTMLAGLRLMMLQSAGFSSVYFGTPMGRTYLLGGAAAIIAFAVGFAVNRPAMTRMSELGAAMAGSDEAKRAAMQAEMATLRKRAGVATAVVTWLLIGAAAAMAVGRYM
jgi:uncharacterized membrane protein